MNDNSIHSISGKNCGRHQDKIMPRDKIASLFFVIMIVLSLAGCGVTNETATAPITDTSILLTPTQPTKSLPEGWIEKVSDIVWVAYSPSSSNPNTGVTPDEIIADLAVLRDAGFNGLVTYGSAGTMGRELPALAQGAGFEGMIMGIWDPGSQEEYDAAINAAQNNIVLGYCIGNEGFNRPRRYDMSKLSASIQKLREATGKPVTTTAGAKDEKLSEEAQNQYFVELANTDVNFVYFEAFDQPWRTSLPIEAHWGIFNSDRTPKLLGWQLMGKVPPLVEPLDTAFYIYKDAGWPDNHFAPSGYLGDIGDIHINQVYTENPHSGSSAIEVVYDAAGAAPNNCDYSPLCKWSGVYWLEPPNNWGLDPTLDGKGFDLSEYSRLKLWARADRSCAIKFLVGGIDKPYGDSLKFPKEKVVKLTQQWQEVEIDLAGADLSYIIGGFAWIADWNMVLNESCTFYLDEIRFEK